MLQKGTFDNMICLGTRIRSARTFAGFTQESLAEALGVSRTAVARWESGDIEPRLHNIVRMAELLCVSSDYLLGINSRRMFICDNLSDEANAALESFIKAIKRS